MYAIVTAQHTLHRPSTLCLSALLRPFKLGWIKLFPTHTLSHYLSKQSLLDMDCLLQCLGRRPRTTTTVRLEDDNATHAADSFVDTVFLAEKNGIELRQALERLVERDTWRQTTWRERFAKAVFEALQKAIETARPMGDALRDIHEKVKCAVDGVEGFVKNHPIECTLIALGILVLLSPWVIEALGFAEGGILEGEKLDILLRCDHLFQVLTLRRRLLCG